MNLLWISQRSVPKEERWLATFATQFASRMPTRARVGARLEIMTTLMIRLEVLEIMTTLMIRLEERHGRKATGRLG